MMMKAVLIGLWLLLLSCNRNDLALFKMSTYFPKESTGDIVVFLPNTSPDNVFANLMTSYNHRDIQHYDSLLAPDYRFYMSESFLGYFIRNNTAPDAGTWTPFILDSSGVLRVRYYMTRARDLESVRRMFDPSGQAKDIDLDFQYRRTDTESDTSTTAIYALGAITLNITLRSNVVYSTLSSRGADITQVTLIRGKDNLWRILSWKDGTYGEGDDQ